MEEEPNGDEGNWIGYITNPLPTLLSCNTVYKSKCSSNLSFEFTIIRQTSPSRLAMTFFTLLWLSSNEKWNWCTLQEKVLCWLTIDVMKTNPSIHNAYPTKLQAAVYLCDLSYFAYFLDIRHVFWCFHNGKVNTNFEVFCKAQTERKQSKCRKANSSNPRFNKEHST